MPATLIMLSGFKNKRHGSRNEALREGVSRGT